MIARGAAFILRGTMTIGELTVFLAYLTRFFKPVQDLAKMSNTLAQAAVGVERVQALLETDVTTPERADALDPPPLTAKSHSIVLRFTIKPISPC